MFHEQGAYVYILKLVHRLRVAFAAGALYDFALRATQACKVAPGGLVFFALRQNGYIRLTYGLLSELCENGLYFSRIRL